jgi:hypothetical protein
MSALMLLHIIFAYYESDIERSSLRRACPMTRGVARRGEGSSTSVGDRIRAGIFVLLSADADLS